MFETISKNWNKEDDIDFLITDNDCVTHNYSNYFEGTAI